MLTNENRVKVGDKIFEFETAEKMQFAEQLLRTYLKRESDSQENLEALFPIAIELHRRDPRYFGVNLIDFLTTIDDGHFEAAMNGGISTNVVLDRLAFPSQQLTDAAREGWPAQKYLPDGFSFMSHNPDINRPHTDLSGEKIRIDKLALIKTLPQTEFVAFAKGLAKLTSELPVDDQGRRFINGLEKLTEIYQHISDFIQFAYRPNHLSGEVRPMATESVLLNEYVKNPTEAVCRHRELLAETLLQMFGMPGEALECHMYISDQLRGNHLATRLKTQNSSYIIDFTNPDFDGEVFIEKIADGVNPETDINQVMWKGKRRVGKSEEGMEVTYLTKQSPAKTYYRILHGWT